MTRINLSTETVQTLPLDYRLFEIPCPKKCPTCGNENMHRHATYTRYVYTEDRRYQIAVPRFICTSCRHTTNSLPDFVGSHQPMSWTVQEQVHAACEDGLSLEDAASTVSPPTGPISARTSSRWRKKWRTILTELEAIFWYAVLAIRSGITLPVGQERPHSLYSWMNRVWQYIRQQSATTCLFHFLHRIRRSSSTLLTLEQSHTTCLSPPLSNSVKIKEILC